MTLRCVITIVPHGDENKQEDILLLDIFNKGEGMFGHHRYGVVEIGEHGAGLWEKEVMHRRHLGAAELVRKVLAEYATREQEQTP